MNERFFCQNDLQFMFFDVIPINKETTKLRSKITNEWLWIFIFMLELFSVGPYTV